MSPSRAELVLLAQRAGYQVEYSPEEYGGWIVITPSRARHPSQILASYKTSDRAWVAAGMLATQ